MKNILNPAPAITDKIEKQIDILTQNLVKMYQDGRLRPQWARASADFGKMYQFIQNSIIKTISTTLNQEKWLSSKDKLALSKNLKHYITSQTQRVFENVTGKNTAADNQALNNKKHKLAKNFFLARLDDLYNFYSQLRADKEHKKWLRLLAAAKARKKAEEEYKLLNQQNDDHQPKEAPAPLPHLVLPLPKAREELEHVVDDYYIFALLQKLDLDIGAGLKEITERRELAKEEYNETKDEARYKEILETCDILEKLGDPRLKKTTEISEEELNDFADNLQPHLPNIKEGPVPYEDIETAVYEFNMKNSTQTNSGPANEFTIENAIQKNLDAQSPTARTPMQKLELTLKKLEHRFGSGQSLVNIGEMIKLMKNENQDNRTNQSPRPTLTPRNNFKGG